ncbi:hypothetical protein CI105_05815 [Candidatus Izimaplasma bacterium ZiA1]|uniref:XdhC family protein n=1 Tax=Candidatus Izimoplasma sp. ZiA1 TaxID=2024899 RepID=UPI000BAA828C|nr:hypothetical protein CI105_05815 [Candidatus Izimaplasma bacterium ZiA1]
MDIYQRVHEYKTKGIAMVLVTVTEKKGEGPVDVGKKMLVTDTLEAFGTVGGGALEYNAREYCKTIINEKKSYSLQYLLDEGKVIKDVTTLPMVCGGIVTLFYEYIGPNEYIYIFGAGHVGQALTNVIKTMNYHVTVVDERTEVIEVFKKADVLVNMPFTKYIEEIGLKENSFVVVCTPSHKHDYNVINMVMEKQIKLAYIGMLCSKEKLKTYIDKTYETFGNKINLKNFYSPIGLDLGGGSPEEIAISITSEIMSVSNNKTELKNMREVLKNDNYHYWED